jgi:hypothetical protein
MQIVKSSSPLWVTAIGLKSKLLNSMSGLRFAIASTTTPHHVPVKPPAAAARIL